MIAAWVVEEMKAANLSDKRLDRRLCEVLSDLSARPTASIPAACGGFAEMVAAYRLFENEKVRLENVLQPHIEATRIRVAARPVVIATQDTSELNLTRPQQQVRGAGPLDGGARRGVLLHLLHAFTPDGTPLGTLAAQVWAREDLPLPSKEERAARRKKTPIEDKESQRWVDMLRQVQAEARRAPQTRFVCVADSESDIFELLAEAQAEPRSAEWIVRAGQNRALQSVERSGENAAAEEATAALLRERLLQRPRLYNNTIHIRGREPKIGCTTHGREQPRTARTATVEIRAASVVLQAPWRPDRKLRGVSVNAVLVREIDQPAGESPVEWLLLTSLPIDDETQVRLVIQYYVSRWMIEVFFKTLKSGCRAEQRRFESLDSFLPCLAVYLIVTWRTLLVCRLGRGCPDISCEMIFDPAEWRSVYRIVRDQYPPKTPPRLAEMVRLVAQLGGYVNRKRDDDPGPQTVWLGLQRMHDMALCWKTFGPGCQAKAEDV
jgi:Transposase DNA-binding/Transposase Tn5 dimerisation domain/Transposase DDE domain